MLNWSQRLVNDLRQDRNHGIVLPNTDWELVMLRALQKQWTHNNQKA